MARAGAPPAPRAALDTDRVPGTVVPQVRQACGVIERDLAGSLRAVHLFGSALDGGLKPYSDIDLLVTVGEPPDEAARRRLALGLLAVSAPPGTDAVLRPLEVTVICRRAVVPWRHPARRELQFGEWLRRDLCAGTLEPPQEDPDLAVLLTKVRLHGIALLGPPTQSLFEPVPPRDLRQALAETLAQWQAPPDWAGDERNIVLALARIWYSAGTGDIAPKEVAAEWALPRLPAEHQVVLRHAREAYLGRRVDNLGERADEVTAFVRFVKDAASTLLPG